jgi:hypothetical protein
LADGDDLAGFLGDGDEAIGRDHAQLPMVPADQRLIALQLAGADLVLGLIEQAEFLAYHRHAQIGGDLALVRAASSMPDRSRRSIRAGPPWPVASPDRRC